MRKRFTVGVLLQWQESSLQNYSSFQNQFTIQTSDYGSEWYSNVEGLTQSINKSPEINNQMVQIWRQLGQILFDICGNN